MKTKQGFVYFIEEVGEDRVKIGYSTWPWSRLNNMKTASANRLVLLWVFAGTREHEAYFHWLFQNHRVRGEWFTLSAVVAGFRHYGVDPDNFPKPDRYKFAGVPVGPARGGQQLVDPDRFALATDGTLVRKRRPRGPRRQPKQSLRSELGWASEEYLADSSGMTVEELRKMKQRIRDEWEREHPGQVPYWRRA